jgi:biopolymer transport protein TolR
MQTGGGGNGGGSGSRPLGGYTPARRQAGGAMGEINVTPLVDVVLVLLLVFMITAPMMSKGIDVTLPVAKNRSTDEEERITVSINAEGRTYLRVGGADQPFALPLLVDRLKTMMASSQNKVAFLRADESLRYSKIIELMDLMKEAGVEQVGLSYQSPTEKKGTR